METSDDYSKIVRADYENLERMKEAQEAQRAWKIGSWAQHYIENGRVVAHIKDSEAITSIDRNRVRLGLDLRQRGNKELLETYYGPTSFRDTLIFVFNPGDAVVDWQPCIRQHREAVKKVCLQTGGQIYKGALHALEHDGREVTAVVLVDGARIETKGVDVVLAVGAWTAEILGRFHMQLPPQGRNPTPTGLFAFRLELNDDQVEFFKDKPVFSHIGRGSRFSPSKCSSLNHFQPSSYPQSGEAVMPRLLG